MPTSANRLRRVWWRNEKRWICAKYSSTIIYSRQYSARGFSMRWVVFFSFLFVFFLINHIHKSANIIKRLIKFCNFTLQYLRSGWWGNYSFKCQPVDYSNNPLALRVSVFLYLAYIISTSCIIKRLCVCIITYIWIYG